MIMAEFVENENFFHLLEQPKTTYRFLYEQEVETGRKILKGSNNFGRKTFPAVEIKNCTGEIIVRCSIYQCNAVDKEFFPHPNELIMMIDKKEYYDPHHIVVGPENEYRAEFNKLIISITKKKHIISTLVRKKCQLKKEYIARTEGYIRELSIEEFEEIQKLAELESKCINRDVVCLRFDAFTEKNGILYPVCKPLFSEPVFNTRFLSEVFSPFSQMKSKNSRLAFIKSRNQELITGSAYKNDLNIFMLSCVTSNAKGNARVILLTKLNIENLDNIKVRFYELDDEGNLVWEDWGSDVQVLFDGIQISLKTPKYRNEFITAPVNVFIELVRPMIYPSSKARSFRYIPNVMRTTHFIHEPVMRNRNTNVVNVAVFSSMQIEQIIDSSLFNSWNIPNGFDEDLPIAADNFKSEEFKNLYTEYQQKFATHFKTLKLDTPQSSEQSFRYSRKFDKCLDILTVTADDKLMAITVLEDLIKFIGTIHTTQQAVQTLNYLLGRDNIENALQIVICLNENKSAIFLIKMIVFYKAFNLLESRRKNMATPLHTAVLCRNEPAISSLLFCGAKVSSMDANLNTALHLATIVNASIDIIEIMLRDKDYEKISDFIEMQNSDGDTALTILINKREPNLEAIKLLCQKNVNINQIHPKNGFVPARLAVERENVDMFKFFLNLQNINPYIEDFMGSSPLTVALSSSNPEIRSVAQNYHVNK